MTAIIVITIVVYTIFIASGIFIMKRFFERTDEAVSREVLEILAGERYRVVTNKSYRRKINNEKRDQNIYKKWLRGKRKKELAEEYNLSRHRIGQILRNKGVRTREERKKIYKKLIKKYLGQGFSKVKTAEKIGISRQTIYRILKEEHSE